MTDLLAAVRIATPADEDGIMDLCRMGHGEIGLFPLDVDQVAPIVRGALYPDKRPASVPMGIIGVIGPVGSPVAAVITVITNVWYTNPENCHIEETISFVHPEHRKSTYAKSLVAFAKEMSDKLDLPLLTGITTTKRTEAKIRLYERWLPKAGAFFFYHRSSGNVL